MRACVNGRVGSLLSSVHTSVVIVVAGWDGGEGIKRLKRSSECVRECSAGRVGDTAEEADACFTDK